eukprot:TRINITY_DN3575_c0_g1_i1.p1 TRINITY_DN3575_c0_g1~~TRINITY_DN3575_c0_g1_i1.p1  ORF type:complete len:937 (-),score=135.71 TRINITY_DN3575_c0_g1_i1:130-2940(-)
MNDFNSLPTYKFDHDENTWKEVFKSKNHSSIDIEQLTVIVYNVLFDKYDAEKLYTHKRIPALLDLLRHESSDIVGLCEVTQSLLIEILRDPYIQETYYISDSGHGVTVLPYGQVILSKYPFSLASRAFSKQKRVVIGTWMINNRKLHIPVVHLTSSSGKTQKPTYGIEQPNSTDPTTTTTTTENKQKYSSDDKNRFIQRRAQQMSTIYSKITPSNVEIDDGSDSILIGDFNVSDGDHEESILFRQDFIDVWKTLLPNEPGYTYDTERNSFLKTFTSESKRKRLDRILLRSIKGNIVPKQVKIIGDHRINGETESVELFLSDHFGLRAEFTLKRSGPSEVSSEQTSTIEDLKKNEDIQSTDNIVTTQNESVVMEDEKYDFKNLLESRGYFETESGNNARELGLKMLVVALSKILETDLVRIYPIGSYALKTHRPSSDVDCLCISIVPQDLFFDSIKTDLVKALKSLYPSYTFKLNKVVNDSLIPIATVQIENIEYDVQYSKIVDLTTQPNLEILMLDSLSLSKMDSISHLSLNGYLDYHTVIKYAPNLELFRVAASVIHLWAKSKGVYSNKHGFLAGYSLNVMVLRLYQLFPQTKSVSFLVEKFFEIYSKWDWEVFPVTIIKSPEPTYKIQQKDKITVVTMNRPFTNSVRNATVSTRKIFVNILRQTHEAIAQRGDYDFITKDFDFFGSYKTYLKLTIDAIQLYQFQSWLGWIESRIVDLILRIEKGTNYAVICHPSVTPYQNENSGFPYSCCYYIGLENTRPTEKINIGAEVLDFQTSIDKWVKKNESMMLTVKPIKPLTKIPTPLNLESMSSDDSTVDDNASEKSDKNESQAPDTISSVSTYDYVDRDSNDGQSQDGSKKKLRTSEQIYNRIKWDSAFDTSQCLIGYEDRFLGMTEIQFDLFRHPKTEFIPFHRVWFIKVGGKVVWDREKRLDLL